MEQHLEPTIGNNHTTCRFLAHRCKGCNRKVNGKWFQTIRQREGNARRDRARLRRREGKRKQG